MTNTELPVTPNYASLPEPAQAQADAVSYWRSIWTRLQKNRIALFGLWCIVGLFLLAIGAPLISLNQPFYWNAGQGPEFPWFSALFNRLLFENSVDIFFNVSLAISPLLLVAYLLLRARVGAQRLGRLLPKLLLRGALLLVFALLLLGPERVFSYKNPFYSTSQVINYRAERVRLEASGHPVSAVFPLRPFSYRETEPSESVEPPSSKHWLGTDTEGRDVFARMLYGTRISLTIGVVAVALYVGIGIVLGALAGYFGGWVDSLISRWIEIVICFPSFFLILTLAALIEQRSIFHVMVIIGITNWTGVARLIRAEFLQQKNLDYAQAAIALGLKQPRIIFRHLLPNTIAPVLVTATFGIASAILIESSLSFLGIGDATAASWGQTLNAGRLEQKLWLVLAPGLAIFFVVSVFNLVGEGLRDALDPEIEVVEVSESLLRIRDLKVQFRTDAGVVRAVDGVSFEMRAGETLALVGESGSGKSVTAMSILRLIEAQRGEITAGSILFEGTDLLKLEADAMREVRGDAIAMIFQEPMTSLNPVFTIGNQIGEALALHRGMDGEQARAHAVGLLDLVGIAGSEQRIDEYPHQLSGGMRQRAMIAMALACNPKLLIADEPTTALDVTIQAQILDLLRDLQQKLEMSILLITHDLGVVATLAERVAVMYGGRIVEHAKVEDLFERPKHPYTVGLLRSIPKLGILSDRLLPITGNVPDALNFPSGCRFHPRCPFRMPRCEVEDPELSAFPGEEHQAACFFSAADPELDLLTAYSQEGAK